jgi:hypothetical protein
MSLMWNKNNQAWRLPDPPGKDDGKAGEAAAKSSGNSRNGNDPNFEIDFSEGTEPAQQPSADTSAVAAAQTEASFALQTLTSSGQAQETNLSVSFEVPSLEVPSLEVGSPGEFKSQQYEHGISLRETTPDESQALESPGQLPGLVMVDDPLPPSIGGGSAAVQDMFVAEVLKGAQALTGGADELQLPAPAVSGVPGLETAIAPMPALENQTLSHGETLVFSSSSDADKTLILPETRTEIERAEAQRSGSFQNLPSSTGLEATIATAVHPLAVQGQVEQPDSPRVSELISQGSATIAKPETKKSSASDEKSKLTGEEKTKAGASGKSSDNSPKDKPAAAGKKNAAGSKGAQGSNKAGAAAGAQPQTQIETNTNTNVAQARLSFRQLPKDARIVLGIFVLSVVFSVTLVTIKQFKISSANTETSDSRSASPNSATLATPVSGTGAPSASSNGNQSKAAKPLKVDSERGEGNATDDSLDLQTSKNSNPVVGQDGIGKNSSNSKNDNLVQMGPKNPADVAEDEDAKENGDNKDKNKKSESFFALTRPTSRYAMDLKALAPLFDASVALDRVQPRRVQNLLRQLPKSYAATDATEKNAIREITARYYLQVGALTKATLLFNQACPDPAKSSDVEICLHAARGMLLAGSTDELKQTIELLRPRLVDKLAEWREWLSLLEVSNGLSKPSLESFVQFTDEMIDKGPFMTSEWNLQLSGHFAKILMNVPHKLRIEYLKSIVGNRKKIFEMRLAPGQYGLDIGSYMFPSLLNLLLRYYEMPVLAVQGEEPETDSEFSLMAWVFNVIAQSNMNEPRQTRARLAPLFGEKSFAPLARVIEGHLAAQAGDYQGAAAMISEQIGVVSEVLDSKAEELNKDAQGKRFLLATQRLREFPFLYVEWLFLGVKVASGLSDKELMKTVVLALEDARRRFPELKDEIQYWIMLGRGYRLMGYVAGVEAASKVTEQLVSTPHELGFVMADRIWVLMQKRKVAEARALMRKSLREIAYHSRLLELGAEFAAQWSEDPSSYLKLEQETPKRYENRGRDRALLSFFTIRKLLSNY